MILKSENLSDSDETKSISQTSEGKKFDPPRLNGSISRFNCFSNNIEPKPTNFKSRLKDMSDSFILPDEIKPTEIFTDSDS